MKCITLCQPWASWISLGWKTIETRTHQRFASLVGQQIAIHAGKRWDKEAIEVARPWLSDSQILATPFFQKVSGVVVCTVCVHNHIELSAAHSRPAKIDCEYTRRYGLILYDVRRMKTLVPARGRQGIWNIDLPEEK